MEKVIIPDLDFFLHSNDYPTYPYNKSFAEARHSPIVILHTSGSTGLPQLITVNHGTLASMDANQRIPQLTGRQILGTAIQERRMFMGFPLFHMASFTLTLGLAAYCGVILVLPPPNEPLTPHLIDSIHASAKVAGSALPPSLVVGMCHEASLFSNLASLDFLYCTGGPLPKELGDKISQITHLSTVIGSTETALPPHELCAPEDWEYVRYSPFHGSDFRPIDEDGTYEQYIVRRPELDLFQSVFSTYPELEEFATKDLYRRHPDKPDLWRFCGRSDDMIVFSNAEKFNPIDFESIISSHPAIRSALVGGHGRFQACLLIEPMTTTGSGEPCAELLESIWPTVSRANLVIPTHARVMKDFIVFTNPEKGVERAGKGTVQRSKTLEMYETEIDELYHSTALPGIPPKSCWTQNTAAPNRCMTQFFESFEAVPGSTAP